MINGPSGTVASPEVNTINHLIFQGMKTEFETVRTLKESADLMRFGKAEVETQTDGIDITGAAMEIFYKTGILTKEAFANPNSRLTKDYLDRLKDSFNTSAGCVWQTTPTNTRHDQLHAGRNY